MITTPEGLIGQIQPDGSFEMGDGPAFNGALIYLAAYDFPFVKFFEHSFGAYVRYPNPAMTINGFGAYYKNPWNGCISRDQLTGIIAALIRLKEYKALLRLIIHHGAWLWLFSYNTIDNGKTKGWKWPDLTLFDIWATYLRGFGVFSWILWPILNLLDLHMFFTTIYLNNFDKDDDVISFSAKFLISRECVPTLTSWATSKILDRKVLLEKLKNYWCGWRQNCEMYDLYEKNIIDEQNGKNRYKGIFRRLWNTLCGTTKKLLSKIF